MAILDELKKKANGSANGARNIEEAIKMMDDFGGDGSGSGGGGGSTGGKALRGKKVSILGDSISAYPGYVTPASNAVFYPSGNNSPACDVKSVEDMWWKIVLNKSGMVLGANNSYSGRTLKASATTANIEALGANGDPDIILVYLGTNDANQQLTLGTLDTSVPFNVNSSEVSGNETLGTNLTRAQVEALGNSTFYESVRTMIIRLQWYYPAAKIVFILVGFGSYTRFFANNPYRKATIECCELHGVEYIDTRKAGLHMPRLTKYTFQRVHPNKAGMKLIGEYVYNKLVALYGNHMADIDSDVPVDPEVTLTGLTYTGTLSHEQFEDLPFDPAGLTFTAHFSDGTSIEVDPDDLLLPTSLGIELERVVPSYTYNGVTKGTTPIPITVTPTLLKPGDYRLAIRNSFSDMTCKSSATISTGGTGDTVNSSVIRYMADSRGRRRAACAIKVDQTTPAINGEVLAVTGGSTVHLTSSPEGFTHPVDWSCTELDADGNYVPGGVHAEQWLTGDLTLQANTAYLMITHKATADTGTSSPVQLSTAEIAQLPAAALSIQ